MADFMHISIALQAILQLLENYKYKWTAQYLFWLQALICTGREPVIWLRSSMFTRIIVICFTSLHKSPFHTFPSVSSCFTRRISYLLTKPADPKQVKSVREATETWWKWTINGIKWKHGLTQYNHKMVSELSAKYCLLLTFLFFSYFLCMWNAWKCWIRWQGKMNEERQDYLKQKRIFSIISCKESYRNSLDYALPWQLASNMESFLFLGENSKTLEKKLEKWQKTTKILRIRCEYKLQILHVESWTTYIRVFFFSLYLILALSLASRQPTSKFESHGDSPVRNIGDKPQSW